MTKRKNHELSVWEASAEEPGLIAAGFAIGTATGAVGGYVVSQLAGTPVTTSMVVGGAGGALVGTGVAMHQASCIHDAEAYAMSYADSINKKDNNKEDNKEEDPFTKKLRESLKELAKDEEFKKELFGNQ